MIYDFPPLTEIPKGDIQLVEQFGYIDLREAYETGIVNGSLEGVEGSSNGIDSPEAIIGRVDDIFALERASSLYESAVASPAPSNGSPDSGAVPTSE